GPRRTAANTRARHVHAESSRAQRNLVADRAVADDAEPLAPDLAASLRERRGERIHSAPARVDQIGHSPQQEDGAQDDVLRYGHAIDSSRVRDADAELSRSLQIDRLDADTEPLEQAHAAQPRQDFTGDRAMGREQYDVSSARHLSGDVLGPRDDAHVPI